MKTAPLSIAASLTLLAAPLLHSAEPPKKAPAKATPVPAKAATPGPKTSPAPAPAGEPAKGYPDVVAVVEGKEIKASELQQAVGTVLAQQNKRPESVPEDQRAEFFHFVLDQLIMNKLVEKRAVDTKVPEADVTAEIERLKVDMGSEEAFNQRLAASGTTLEQVKESIRSQLRPRQWVASQVKVDKKMTDADAEEYFKKNPDLFKKPEEVRASHILIAVPRDAKPEVVLAKEKAAKEVLARVKGGEDFATVARELSEDPTSNEKGGDLNFFPRQKMVPEFGNAAFSLKPGAISDPVRTEFGFHIIKVTERKDAEEIPLDSVKPKVVAYLQAQEQQKATAKMLQELRAGAEVTVSLP